VSPRFELEAAVSKLAWLSHWVSPTELKAALDGARGVLGGRALPQGTQALPQASPNAAPPVVEPPKPAWGGPPSLSAELDRVIAKKANGMDTGADGTSNDEDEDVPFWNSIAHNKNHSDADPQVERVLRVIPGTVVSPDN
jgi:hypothetical protein